MKKENKVLAFIRIDNFIDIITNSSSELFVLENTMAIPTLSEMVNEVLEGYGKVSDHNIMSRFVKDKENYELDYFINDFLSLIPESDHEEIKKKYFTDTKWYAISFDRDWISDLNCSHGFSVRDALSSIGFELIDTDY